MNAADRQTDGSAYGGNLVRRVESTGECMLADDAYRYRLVPLHEGGSVEVNDLAHGAAYVLSGRASLEHEGVVRTLDADRSVLFTNNSVRFTHAGAAPTLLLVAGTVDRGCAEAAPGVEIPESIKTVRKPWGEERWITGRHPAFAFKRIVLRAGHRTSLQYHEMKRETNLLVSGTARLHHAQDRGVFDPPYGHATLEPMSTVDVWPMTLHRIEAVTDVTLMEVSTPHLDDVIRVQDDSGREDGLIVSEHDSQGRAGDEPERGAHAA